jgi:cell division septum initiation protein DivIVA
MSIGDEADKVRNEAYTAVARLYRRVSAESGQIIQLAESQCQGKTSAERDVIMQQAQRKCDKLMGEANEEARRIHKEAAFRASQLDRLH